METTGKTAELAPERSSNFELMRIVLMVAMVAHHYVVNSGLEQLYELPGLQPDMLFLQIFGMFGKTGINCFTLLTGYFMVTSRVNLRKFLKVYLEVKFYYIGFYLLFLLTGYEAFSFVTLKQALFNVIYEVNWLYTGTYIVFFLLIPVCNCVIRHITKVQYRYTLAFGFVYYTLISTFTELDTFSYLGWMAVMYFLGGYIRLYKEKWTESLSGALAGLGISLVLMCLSIGYIDVNGLGGNACAYYYFVNDSHKILALCCSVCIFLVFKNLKIPQNRRINQVAASTFGILLIHTNSHAMRRFLWKDVFDNTGAYMQGNIVLHALVTVALVFGVSLLIDMARIRWVERPLFRRLDQCSWFQKAEKKIGEIWNM